LFKFQQESVMFFIKSPRNFNVIARILAECYAHTFLKLDQYFIQSAENTKGLYPILVPNQKNSKR